MILKPWVQNYDEGVPAALNYPDSALFDLLDHSASCFPTKACTIFQDQTICFGDMSILTDALAAALADLGLQKGDRVGIMLPNIPQFVLVFYGVLKAGGIVVALNPLYKERELAYQIGDAGVKWLVALTGFLPRLEEAIRGLNVEAIITTEIQDAFQIHQAGQNGGMLAREERDGSTCFQLPNLLASAAGRSRPPVPVSGDDVAVFQYSGGTTGISKGAVGLHRNLVANTIQFRYWLHSLKEGQEMVLAAIPLYHVYGMVIAMSLGIYMGAGLVLIANPRNPEDILRNIDAYQTSIFPGVPNMYGAINNHPDVIAHKYSLHSIRACISGSAPLLKAVKQKFEEVTGGKLLEGYGLSEAPTATHCNPLFGENRTGSIGLPLPDVECRIVDLETGEKDLLPGESGELILRGPQVMKEYHNNPDETAIALRNGWLYTGDVARMDEDGYFYLVDRKKEMIKVGGFQVWPREVEEAIASHPKVQEVGAAGVPHPTRVEIVMAWVVVKEGETLTAEEVKQWCDSQLASYKVPSAVEFRSSIPRTNVGKILRRELVREYKENHPG